MTAWKLDEMDAGGSMPTKGYGSLPYSDAEQNPNLVRVYIDAQHDYLHDRVYLLGALVVASDCGVEKRRRSIVKLAEGPPDTDKAEEDLFLGWVDDTMRAIVELAYPDDQGEPQAPIHVIFWNSYAQRALLDGLADVARVTTARGRAAARVAGDRERGARADRVGLCHALLP